jgi:hypothetical protein
MVGDEGGPQVIDEPVHSRFYWPALTLPLPVPRPGVCTTTALAAAPTPRTEPPYPFSSRSPHLALRGIRVVDGPGRKSSVDQRGGGLARRPRRRPGDLPVRGKLISLACQVKGTNLGRAACRRVRGRPARRGCPVRPSRKSMETRGLSAQPLSLLRTVRGTAARIFTDRSSGTRCAGGGGHWTAWRGIEPD